MSVCLSLWWDIKREGRQGCTADLCCLAWAACFFSICKTMLLSDGDDRRGDPNKAALLPCLFITHITAAIWLFPSKPFCACFTFALVLLWLFFSVCNKSMIVSRPSMSLCQSHRWHALAEGMHRYDMMFSFLRHLCTCAVTCCTPVTNH